MHTRVSLESLRMWQISSFLNNSPHLAIFHNMFVRVVRFILRDPNITNYLFTDLCNSTGHIWSVHNAEQRVDARQLNCRLLYVLYHWDVLITCVRRTHTTFLHARAHNTRWDDVTVDSSFASGTSSILRCWHWHHNISDYSARCVLRLILRICYKSVHNIGQRCICYKHSYEQDDGTWIG